MKLTNLADEALLALATLGDRASDLVSPTVRLGVTGLARAGKTVFITALVHNLLHGGRLPLFRSYSTGRIADARLEPQPDDDVPRFDYEDHVRALVEQRIWPDSTRRISELRLTITYESASYFRHRFGPGRLNLDIVDYPGEWLLDLPLLGKDFATWSREALALAHGPGREAAAGPWLAALAATDPAAPESDVTARMLAAVFTDYLRACRADENALSTLPPGRFLMPGDLEGSPALTFCPLPGDIAAMPAGSLGRMMARRYEAYKSVVVKPFFREHFARLDRQIVLVDALHALNAGPEAVADLGTALGEILTCYRPGSGSWLSSLLTHRIDRILIGATKADHLHHADHDRLETILGHLLAPAIERASAAGARVEIAALASVRATREGVVMQHGERLPSIIGTPLAGERVDGETFDGKTEIAFFPGDLPDDPDSVLQRVGAASDGGRAAPAALRFVRFRPPALERTVEGMTLSLPHIRLDRALEFLIGDRLA
ncbi:YcjX family protein [Kaistia dalseonensis]|uniref:YcjX-like family ATPase n=1 Tax=Kaistia dalseonensis TaxID=410840 RepID=A0ABU0HCL1_9HYPH|nr:YcjX family protein [Kaistia dalseonensis]MCX5497051.1 YcjX family protein [Kaistia dalseonensis]MDQ0439677.1 putative YcjX-like family ATPase [Kaistia dalseonensis]